MKKNTIKQPKLADNGINPAELTPKFAAGNVPTQEDFANLITLSAQVRAVDSSGLDLNDVTGELSVNYDTVSTGLAGSGLSPNGDKLDVNYGTASTTLAGEGLNPNGDKLDVDYGAMSTTLAGKGLSPNGDTLQINFDDIIENISDEIWMKMKVKEHQAHYYVKTDVVVAFVMLLPADRSARCYFYVKSPTLQIYSVLLNGKSTFDVEESTFSWGLRHFTEESFYPIKAGKWTFGWTQDGLQPLPTEGSEMIFEMTPVDSDTYTTFSGTLQSVQ
jgi:hypothetical protein